MFRIRKPLKVSKVANKKSNSNEQNWIEKVIRKLHYFQAFNLKSIKTSINYYLGEDLIVLFLITPRRTSMLKINAELSIINQATATIRSSRYFSSGLNFIEIILQKWRINTWLLLMIHNQVTVLYQMIS